MSMLRTAAILLAAGCFTASAHAANNAEQLVFSGIGLPPVSTEPFGFWVWCQVHPAPSGQGHYDTDCQGAVYFYARGITTHVTGEVSEPEEGVYVMDLVAGKPALSCALSNVPPILKGPNNTVIGDCTLDGQPIAGLMSTGAVVHATGPE